MQERGERASQQARSLRDRFRGLSKKYGWAAVGVYFGLSAIDFPFCYLAVRMVGPDRIGELEHAVVDAFWHIIAVILPSMRPGVRGVKEGAEAEAVEALSEDVDGHHKVKENASMYCRIRSGARTSTNRMPQVYGRNYCSHTVSTNPSSFSEYLSLRQ